jgi:hypothetical protein
MLHINMPWCNTGQGVCGNLNNNVWSGNAFLLRHLSLHRSWHAGPVAQVVNHTVNIFSMRTADAFCMDSYGGAAGANAAVYSCYGGANQRWYIQGMSTGLCPVWIQ